MLLFSKHKYTIIVMSILLIDQLSKILVISLLELNQEVSLVGNVFKIHYVLNDGFAMNTTLGIENGKLFTTLLRIFIVVFAFAYYRIEIKPKYRPEFTPPYVVVLGGTVGNVIDNLFYGLWFGLTSPDAPMLFLHGQVVDMLHIDIWQGEIAQLGNRYFTIFPIMNIADLAMLLGCGVTCYYGIKFRKNYKKLANKT
jgi:signal peptidase II